MTVVALLLALATFVAVSSADAQLQAKTPKLGFLIAGSAPSPGVFIDEFKHVLRDRGWVEGQTMSFEYRYADGRYERLSNLAAELVALKVDVIVTEGTPPTQAVKRATKTIPIVMATTADPVGSGLVASLARPGANLTGASFFFGELHTKRVEILKELLPGIKRMAVLSNPDNSTAEVAVKAIGVVATSLRITLHHFQVRTPGELEAALPELTTKVADALTVVEDPMINARAHRIVSVATRNRLPCMVGHPATVEDGGLIAYGPNRRDLWERAAVLADKILRGAKPGDLPIEQARVFELVVNRKTANTLGLKIPPQLLLRATKVIP